MRFQRFIQSIILSFLIGFISLNATSSEKRRTPSIEILGIHEMVGVENKSKVLLEIQFKNNEKGVIVIPFRGIITKDAYKCIESAYTNKWQIAVNGQSSNFYIGNFASLKYYWNDKNGRGQTEGECDVSHESMSISGGGSSKLFVPITMPEKEGQYVFNLEFDNRSLSVPVLAGNRSLAIRNAFFKQFANARVIVLRTPLERKSP